MEYQLLDRVRIFGVSVELVGPRAVVAVSGELDMASREEFVDACRSGNPTEVVIDLTGLLFMDCRGWSGVVEARRGVSSTLRGEVGQPVLLIDLIRTLELTS